MTRESGKNRNRISAYEPPLGLNSNCRPDGIGPNGCMRPWPAHAHSDPPGAAPGSAAVPGGCFLAHISLTPSLRRGRRRFVLLDRLLPIAMVRLADSTVATEGYRTTRNLPMAGVAAGSGLKDSAFASLPELPFLYTGCTRNMLSFHHERAHPGGTPGF